jgi:hypothetical protein
MRTRKSKEIEAILALDGPARFNRFVKEIVDSEEVWALWQDGWALMKTDDGSPVLPFWPAQEYAQLCRVGDWAPYEPRKISLAEFLDDLLPKLTERGTSPGVFPTAAGRGVILPADQLTAAIREELKRYE